MPWARDDSHIVGWFGTLTSFLVLVWVNRWSIRSWWKCLSTRNICVAAPLLHLKVIEKLYEIYIFWNINKISFQHVKHATIILWQYKFYSTHLISQLDLDTTSMYLESVNHITSHIISTHPTYPARLGPPRHRINTQV